MDFNDLPLPTNTPTPKKRLRSLITQKKVLLLLGLIIVIIFAALAYLFLRQDQQEPVSTNTVVEQQADDSIIRIIASGDMIAHDALNARAESDDGYDYLQFMQNLKPYFDDADVRFCNQAVLAAGEKFGISGFPVFNAPQEFSQDMAALGCNVINTGTNHTNDKDQAAITATVDIWDGIPDVLATAGANRSLEEMNSVRYFETKDVKFAFVSLSTYSNQPNPEPFSLTMYNEETAERLIGEAREQADIVLVSMRWGTEYATEINDQQRQQAQFLTNLGADVIFGHGPHVLQPVEKLQGQGDHESYVWYSLGNFLNAQLDIETLVSTIAVMDYDIDQQQIVSIGHLPIYMHYEWSAEQRDAMDLMARKNFEMFLLESAEEPLSRSLHQTTIVDQQTYINTILNQYLEVPELSSDKFLNWNNQE